ncbi:MAG: MATE family efflux transporter [Chloroflexaceae bacterium]|jgi:MATE family multidrug resistance protein|nr:MATE family efflux transporter [Chloroflexaceae bacterium]
MSLDCTRNVGIERKLTTGGFGRAMLAEVRPLVGLAVPLVAGLTSSTMLGLTDTYFIGALGEVPLAAASLTTSVLLIFFASLYGFLGPVGILVGQAFGAAAQHRIAAVVRHGLALALLGGVAGATLMIAALALLPWLGQPAEVVAVVAPYWVLMALLLVPFCLSLVYKQLYDAVDRPWTGVLLMLVAVVINIPLTWALVEGRLGLPALGLLGAGLSSFIAQTATLLAMVLHHRFAPSMAAYRLPVNWRRAGLVEQVREGVPMALQYLMEGGAVALAGVLIGWLGATALAANQIVFSVSSVLYMVPLGMSASVGIRIAQAAGGQASARLRAIGYTGLALVTVWTALFTVGLTVGGEQIARAFVGEADVIALATVMCLAIGVMQIFDGVQSVMLGALRGILDTRWPTLVSLVAYWLLALPLGYGLAFGLGMGAPGVWAGFAAGLALAAVLLSWRFRRKSG